MSAEIAFSEAELKRYIRHLPLSEVGLAGQQQLRQAKVLCVGAGGLGSPLLNYLNAAGVGCLGIIDHDVVETSNLQRQTIFNMDQIGLNKALAAKAILEQQNPFVSIQAYEQALDADNALDIIAAYDYVADCTDNALTKYIINDACFHLKKPLIYASISQFEGLCSVLCGESNPCYRCLFPEPAPVGLIKNCADNGVLGTTAGLFGLLQANEVLKLILGIGNRLEHKLLSFNALQLSFNIFETKPSDDCLLCAQNTPFADIDRHIPTCTPSEDMKSISVAELKTLLKTQDVNLIDVRGAIEHQYFNLGGLNIPLSDLEKNLTALSKNITLILYCQSGVRSFKACELLQQHGFEQVQHLQGGVNQWLKES